MRGLAAAQVSPGARTCVLIGESEDLDPDELARYRSILWFTRHAAPALPRGIERSRVRNEVLDRLDADRTTAALDTLIQSDASHLPSVYITAEATSETAAAFVPVLESIFAQLERHQRARITRQRDGLTWQRHVLANLAAYSRQRLPSDWQGALAGVPAFICGSGPSLQTALPVLAGAAGRGVILAADSALRGLASAGIVPDFALTVDASKTPAKCLVPGRPTPPRVIAASVSPPEWQHVAAAEGVFYVSGKQLSEDAIAQAGAPRTGVAVDENCGITAVGLAVHLGCAPIYFFGLDHAVDSADPSRLHQRDADPSGDVHVNFRAGHSYPRVPGNYQAEVATPFFREWRRLDALCAGLPAGLIHNIIDRGARLANTTLIPPDRFVPPPAKDKHSRLARLSGSTPMEPMAWKTIVAQLRRLADLATPPLVAARRAVADGRRRDASAHLAGVFGRREFSLLFGNYSLRILPHLTRPEETEPELWTLLLDECAELIALGRLVN